MKQQYLRVHKMCILELIKVISISVNLNISKTSIIHKDVLICESNEKPFSLFKTMVLLQVFSRAHYFISEKCDINHQIRHQLLHM